MYEMKTKKLIINYFFMAKNSADFCIRLRIINKETDEF